MRDRDVTGNFARLVAEGGREVEFDVGTVLHRVDGQIFKVDLDGAISPVTVEIPLHDGSPIFDPSGGATVLIASADGTHTVVDILDDSAELSDLIIDQNGHMEIVNESEVTITFDGGDITTY